MRIVILQPTFNSTTVGWVRGLEARGHQVVMLIGRRDEPVGGWPDDLDVLVVPDENGLVDRIGRVLLPGRKSAVYRLPRLRVLRRALIDCDADAVLVKVHSLRSILELAIAASLRLRRLAWIEQVPPPNLEWRVLRRFGILPRRMFTALDARPGGIADPLDPPAAGMPVITYAPVLPACAASAVHDDGEGTDRPSGPLRILTVASFWEVGNKRQLWTLEAARLAGLLDGRAHFTFVGAGKERKGGFHAFRAAVAAFDVDDLVDIRLNVPFVRMPEVYAAHDILVLASRREQFGMVVPEAMAHGLTVVASETVGCIGCIVPGVTGEVFGLDDLRGLADALHDLAADPERRRQMGRAAREFIERHGSPDDAARAIERLLSAPGSGLSRWRTAPGRRPRRR